MLETASTILAFVTTLAIITVFLERRDLVHAVLTFALGSLLFGIPIFVALNAIFAMVLMAAGGFLISYSVASVFNKMRRRVNPPRAHTATAPPARNRSRPGLVERVATAGSKARELFEEPTDAGKRDTDNAGNEGGNSGRDGDGGGAGAIRSRSRPAPGRGTGASLSRSRLRGDDGPTGAGAGAGGGSGGAGRWTGGTGGDSASIAAVTRALGRRGEPAAPARHPMQAARRLDQTRTEHARTEQTRAKQAQTAPARSEAGPSEAGRPESERPGQIRPAPARKEQTRPDQARSDAPPPPRKAAVPASGPASLTLPPTTATASSPPGAPRPGLPAGRAPAPPAKPPGPPIAAAPLSPLRRLGEDATRTAGNGRTGTGAGATILSRGDLSRLSHAVDRTEDRTGHWRRLARRRKP